MCHCSAGERSEAHSVSVSAPRSLRVGPAPSGRCRCRLRQILLFDKFIFPDLQDINMISVDIQQFIIDLQNEINYFIYTDYPRVMLDLIIIVNKDFLIFLLLF